VSAAQPNPVRKQPLGPRGHWLLGNLKRLWADPIGLYQQAWREYGDNVRIRLLPGVPVFLITHPDAVEHVLQKNHRNYRKPDLVVRPISLLIGNGLFSSEGDFWLRQRRLMQPAFHRQHLARLAPLMVAAVETFVREREVAGMGVPFDILPEMMRLSLRVASTTLFGADMAGEADAIGRAYRTAFEYVSHRMNSLQLVPAWLPTRRNRAFARVKKLLDRVVLELIEARRKSADRPSDLLSLLLAAQDEQTGAGMTDRQLRDEVLTLLTAGHETVGAALSWAWYLLGRHPQAQEELHDEVRGRLQGRGPTLEDLPQLPLARAVFEEALRLYPPAWGMAREAV
jgi:cytochrome P450